MSKENVGRAREVLEGKVTGVDWFDSKADALKAAGLSE